MVNVRDSFGDILSLSKRRFVRHPRTTSGPLSSLVNTFYFIDTAVFDFDRSNITVYLYLRETYWVLVLYFAFDRSDNEKLFIRAKFRLPTVQLIAGIKKLPH